MDEWPSDRQSFPTAPEAGESESRQAAGWAVAGVLSLASREVAVFSLCLTGCKTTRGSKVSYFSSFKGTDPVYGG